MKKNNNKKIILGYRIILVIISFIGLYLNFKLNNFKVMTMLTYFTILSNLFCFLYYLVIVIKMIKDLKKFNNDYNPFLKGSLLVMLSTTFFIFHTVLKPITIKFIGIDFFISPANLIVHYVVPILTIIDWLLFDKKGKMTRKNIYNWFIFPTIYLVFILVKGHTNCYYPISKMNNVRTRYPYQFIDLDQLGLPLFIRNILIIFVLLFIISSLYIYLDKYFAKRNFTIK